MRIVLAGWMFITMIIIIIEWDENEGKKYRTWFRIEIKINFFLPQWFTTLNDINWLFHDDNVLVLCVCVCVCQLFCRWIFFSTESVCIIIIIIMIFLWYTFEIFQTIVCLLICFVVVFFQTTLYVWSRAIIHSFFHSFLFKWSLENVILTTDDDDETNKKIHKWKIILKIG